MWRSLLAAAAAAGLGAAALSGGASAQEADVYLYDDDPDIVVTDEADAYVDDAPIVEDGDTRVYGFVAARPSNCGEFKYLDGASCLDARDKAPDVK